MYIHTDLGLTTLIRSGYFVALGLLVLFPSIVPAQQGSNIEEITVTATRRAESIQDIPYNISAVSGDQLIAANVDSLSELTQTIPGIAYADFGVRSSGVNNQLILRGLNANARGAINAFLTGNSTAAVSTYIDNTPLFVDLKLNDIERVEVLRGPQGTLYGSGSVGGTLRFLFNKPDPTAFSAKVSAGIKAPEDSGDLGYSVDGVMNIPINDNVALRFSAGYEEVAGFTDGNGLVVGGYTNPQLADPTDPFGTPFAKEMREDIDGAERWFLRSSLLWNINDKIDAQLTYTRQEDEADDFSAQTNPVQTIARERTHDRLFTSPIDREVDLASLEVRADLGFAELQSTTSYTRNEQVSEGDLSGLAQNLDLILGGFAYGGWPATNGRLSMYFVDTQEVESVVQEIRLISQVDDSKWDWVAGFYFEDNSRNNVEPIVVPTFADYANTPGHPFTAFLPVPPFLSWANIISGPPGFVTPAAVNAELAINLDTSIDTEDIAFYGELTYRVTDAWQITAGARVFWNENKGDLSSLQPLSGALVSQTGMDPSGLNSANVASDEQDEIFKVNTSYDVNEDLMAYFTWAQGYRRGGANSLVTTGFVAEDPSDLTYQSDTVNNYEVGIKGTLFDRLRYTAAIYRVDWDQPQLSAGFLPSGFPGVINVGDARTEGLELEADWNINDQWRLSGGYAYTDAKFTEDLVVQGPNDVFPDASSSAGDLLPGVPEHMATWAIDYYAPVKIFGSSELHVRVDGNYRSAVVTDLDPNSNRFARLEGFSIWNASLNWSKDQWNLSAYVKNFTDEIGVSAAGADFAHTGPQSDSVYIIRPRTFGLRLGYSF